MFAANLVEFSGMNLNDLSDVN